MKHLWPWLLALLLTAMYTYAVATGAPLIMEEIRNASFQ